MRYYTYYQKQEMPVVLDAALQRYFPENEKWGCDVLIYDGKVENVEICELHDVNVNSSMWRHYANIFRIDENAWEVNTRFNGSDEDEMWVYKTFTKFGNAVRFIAHGGIEKNKPNKIY